MLLRLLLSLCLSLDRQPSITFSCKTNGSPGGMAERELAGGRPCPGGRGGRCDTRTGWPKTRSIRQADEGQITVRVTTASNMPFTPVPGSTAATPGSGLPGSFRATISAMDSPSAAPTRSGRTAPMPGRPCDVGSPAPENFPKASPQFCGIEVRRWPLKNGSVMAADFRQAVS